MNPPVWLRLQSYTAAMFGQLSQRRFLPFLFFPSFVKNILNLSTSYDVFEFLFFFRLEFLFYCLNSTGLLVFQADRLMILAGRKQLQAHLLPLAIPGKDSFFATRLSTLCCASSSDSCASRAVRKSLSEWPPISYKHGYILVH